MKRKLDHITVTPREIDKTSPNYLCSKIRAYCFTYGINREELAKVTGLSKATISAYNSNAENLTVTTINRFCRTYNINNLTDLENF